MSKLKSIKITKDNINDVYARLFKFFYNKKETGFEVWMNENCGLKKRIKRKKLYEKYPQPLAVELHKDEEYMDIVMVVAQHLYLYCGDEIVFISNRIIIKHKIKNDNRSCTFQYTVIQAIPMSMEEQNAMHNYAADCFDKYVYDYYH